MFLIAAVTVVPALVLLFTLDQRNRLQEGAVVAGQERAPRHRVVIVGGGFGGLFATRALGWSPVDVTLIDRQPHHLFQPLLYQVATGILSEGEIAPSLRHVLRDQGNAAVVLAEVTGFDLQARVVRAQRPDGTPIEVPYDSLIVAAGAGLSYFGHDELATHAPGMKTLADALNLRARLLQALEMAELSEDPKQREGWLTTAIVGAGPSGVEIAGQVRELAQRALGTSFRRIDPGKVRVVLLDAGHEPLSHFGDRLSEIASRELAAMGVELRMGVRVTATDDERGRRAERRRRVRADRRAHRDLGGRRAGIPGRGHARRRVRGDPGSRRTDRDQPGLHAPQSPRRVRDRRHGQPRQAPGRRRGGDATGATRRAGHSPFRRREARRTAGLQVPRSRQHGDRRTLQRDRQPQGPPPRAGCSVG